MQSCFKQYVHHSSIFYLPLLTLLQAIDACIAKMTDGLKGKKHQKALHQQHKLSLLQEDWDLLKVLLEILGVCGLVGL